MSHQLFDRDFEQLWYNFRAGLPILLDEVRRLIVEIESGGRTE